MIVFTYSNTKINCKGGHIMLRALKRSVARKNMKDDGYAHLNKGKPSFFSRRWRDFIKPKKRRQ